MLEKLVARLPALLVALSLLLLAQVALVQGDEPALLVGGAPAALLLVTYLRAGRSSRRRSRA